MKEEVVVGADGVSRKYRLMSYNYIVNSEHEYPQWAEPDRFGNKFPVMWVPVEVVESNHVT